jgi:rod shape-determining protein MreC
MPHKKFLSKLLIIAVVLFGVIFFNNRVLGNFIQNVFYKISAKPGQFLTSKLQIFARYSAGFLNTKSIIANNAKLKNENEALLGQMAELETLQRENQFLRGQLGVAKNLNLKILLARIFNIQKSAQSSTILINKGKADGVKKSMAVITSGNILVGIVDQVFDTTSRILIIDDPRAKINGRIQGSNTLVSTSGGLGGNLVLDLITNQEDVKEGDIIVTNGLDGLPQSLPMAKVTKVEITGGSLFKKVQAKAIFDSALGSDLFVILNE